MPSWYTRSVLAWREHATNKKRGLRVHVATAYFVPKPHTPFQWEKQITPQEYLRRCKVLKEHFYSKSIEYDYHSPDLSRLEAVFAGETGGWARSLNTQ